MPSISFLISCIENSETGQPSVEEAGSVPVPANCAKGALIDVWFDADESAQACAEHLTTQSKSQNTLFGYRVVGFGLFPDFEVVQLDDSILRDFINHQNDPIKYLNEYQAEAVCYNLSKLDQKHVYQVESTSAQIGIGKNYIVRRYEKS